MRGIDKSGQNVMSAEALDGCRTMQIASVRGNQPWIATVYFVWYEGCFYWLSFPERRHSEELLDSSKAAIAIVIESTQPVVGLQAEGDVNVVADISEAEPVLGQYIEKYDQGKQFIELMAEGTNKHVLYRFRPRYTAIFDERGARGSGPTQPREIAIL